MPARDEPAFETGQIVVDKRRCWAELQLTMHFNEWSDFYYQHVHGDKETFHLAWRKLELPFAMETAVLEVHDGVWTAPAEGFDEGEPLRRWTALDADGEVIASEIGESFVAPEGTDRVEVLVGAVVALAHDLE